MREIKFRGRLSPLEYAYGQYYLSCSGTPMIIDDRHIARMVEPGSVRQLVCVKDGKEYYEGDELIKDGRRRRCRLATEWEDNEGEY